VAERRSAVQLLQREDRVVVGDGREIGERRAALLGIVVAGTGYVGYGLANQGWMMFAWLSTWFFGAMVMPSTNALMSRTIPADAQGELQGAVASLFSLSSIIGPPLMTHIFSRFATTVPGAAFFTAGILAAACFVTYWAATRALRTSPVVQEAGA